MPRTGVMMNNRGVTYCMLEQIYLNIHLFHVLPHISEAIASEGTSYLLDHLPTLVQLQIQHHDLKFRGKDLLLQIHHQSVNWECPPSGSQLAR